MFWIGSEEAIAPAKALAAKEVVGEPEYREGVRVPKRQWITKRWAEPRQTANGAWVIPAYDGLEPAGVTLVGDVIWPEYGET